MKRRITNTTLSFIFIFFGSSICLASAQACQTGAKHVNWAPDQRDSLKLTCLSKKKDKLNTMECLKVAQGMEYSISSEKARWICLQNLGKSATVKECYTIARRMEYPDTGDDARWECLRRFQQTISLDQCKKIANSMSYPANAQRADFFCTDERK